MASDTQQKKLGLALSGGGFRASFFHIGVLAQLAEQGQLRHVEVISTVSGGSIIGALYYLHIKKLLESTPDAAVSNQDYVDLVKTIETDFKAATDKNIRMATFADFKSNFKMRRPDYSRSDRISELYNDFIYQKVLKEVSNPVQMRELKIFPLIAPDTWDKEFSPRTGNAGRQAKVPMLVINATSLNTGRAWQFTAQSMGEPIAHKADGTPDYEETDSKPLRLRWARPSYDSIVPHQQSFELGHAVGASACVPALFPPLAISGLYQDGDQPIRVQLVDGGVFDNQGVESLLYEGCTHLIVSDASGQTAVENEPKTGTFPVLQRVSDGIYPDRIRTESLVEIFNKLGRENVAFMHLRKGLEMREIPWIGNDGKPDGPVNTLEATSQKFGVAPQVQELLSKIRTDLDAFSEVEAYSLMLDGYLMSSSELMRFRDNAGYALDAEGPNALPESGDWAFFKISQWISDPSKDYLNQLETSQSLFGKTLKLIPALWIPLALALAVALYFGWPYLAMLLTQSISVLAIAGLLLLWLIDWAIDAAARKLGKNFPPIRLARVIFASGKSTSKAVFFVLGTLFISFYLRFVNPLYLWRGSVEALDLAPLGRLAHFWKWLKSKLCKKSQK